MPSDWQHVKWCLQSLIKPIATGSTISFDCQEKTCLHVYNVHASCSDYSDMGVFGCSVQWDCWGRHWLCGHICLDVASPVQHLGSGQAHPFWWAPFNFVQHEQLNLGTAHTAMLDAEGTLKVLHCCMKIAVYCSLCNAAFSFSAKLMQKRCAHVLLWYIGWTIVTCPANRITCIISKQTSWCSEKAS